MGGNLVPVTKSGEQLYINFHAFRENRLPMTVRIRDANQDSIGRIAFMREPKVARGEAPQTPICNLNITLPDLTKGQEVSAELDPEELKRKYELMKSGGAPPGWCGEHSYPGSCGEHLFSDFLEIFL